MVEEVRCVVLKCMSFSQYPVANFLTCPFFDTGYDDRGGGYSGGGGGYSGGRGGECLTFQCDLKADSQFVVIVACLSLSFSDGGSFAFLRNRI